MAYAITNTLRALLDRAGVARATIADASFASYNATVTPADLGAALYTRGIYQVRLKNWITTVPTANAATPVVMTCLVSDSTPGGQAAAITGVVGTHVIPPASLDMIFVGFWERTAATGRYFYVQAYPAGAIAGPWAVILDAEVVGIP